MKTHSMILVLLTLTMLGCGSGDEDSNVASQKVLETSTSTDSQPKEVIATSALVSTPEFDFISATKLRLTLPAFPSATINYYINICTDFSNENGDIKINYNSCKLRTKITTQTQQFTLSLSTVERQLIAQIWPIENGAQPINTFWDITESGNDWQIYF